MDGKKYNLDGIEYVLKESHDFSWLGEFGKVFRIFDQQDSGNICFGVRTNLKKLFIKYAGAKTVNYEGDVEDAIERLKKATKVYESLSHPLLVKFLYALELPKGYALVFEWKEGDCLYAHLSAHIRHSQPFLPKNRFHELPVKKRIQFFNQIVEFHLYALSKGYVAIDFYDGCLMFDFESENLSICDIDFYDQLPYENMMGRMWGSSRFLSPEEKELGGILDESTTVYTMGATAFELLGSNRDRSLKSWEASKELFGVAKKAVNDDKLMRYPTLKQFYQEWSKKGGN